MTTPKKNKVEESKQEDINQFSLEATAEKWSTLFSKKYAGYDYMSAFGNAFTNNPFIQNQRLKQLKSLPNFHSRDTIESAVQQPEFSEQTLREASWGLSSTAYPLYKIMRFYSDVLTYNYYAYSKYVDEADMKTPRYKSDSKLVHMFLDRLQPKYTFRRIALEVAREGKRAYVLRLDADNKTGSEKVDTAFLQELPSNWWKPTSKTGDSYLGVSFNFAYFWQAGTSIEQFPPIFKQYYEELMHYTIEKDGKKSIDIANIQGDAIVEYNKGNWYYWHELDPSTTFVFSSDESHVWISPSFAGLFLQIQDLSSYQLLQQQLTSIPLNSMVLAQIPLHDESTNKTGSKTNDLRLSDMLVTGFQMLFSDIAPSGTGLYVSPFENYQHITFPQVPNGEKIYHEALSQIVATAGTNGLMSTSDKPTSTQVKSAQLIEKRVADVIYDQFMNCVNIIFEQHLGLKYNWKFKMFGDIFTHSEELQSVEKGLSLGMNYLLPKYGAMHNMDMEDINTLADQVNSSGIYDKFKPLVSAFQSKGEDGKVGRKIDTSGDEDATVQSQDAGSNVSEGRFSLSEDELEEYEAFKDGDI